MTLTLDLQTRFDEIRELYFPRWKKGRKWTATFYEGDLLDYVARCSPRLRTIWLSPECDDIDVTLIHEIVHALGFLGHSDKWIGRMRKAAEKADDLGNPELSRMLLKDVEHHVEIEIEVRERREEFERSYGGWEPSKAESVYSEIEAYVATHPSASFLDAVYWVAFDCGMIVDEMLDKYKRLRHVYEKLN